MLQRNHEQSVNSTAVRAEVWFLVVGAIVTTLARIWQQVETPATICEATAWGTAILGVLFASDMSQRFDLMLDRLFHRGAVELPSTPESILKQQIQRAAARGAVVGSIALPAILLLAYVWVTPEVSPLSLVTWFVEALCASIVGR